MTGVIEIDYANTGKTNPYEAPEWKQELSRRLNEIKQKRESGGASAAMPELPFPSPLSDAPPPAPLPPKRRPVRRRPIDADNPEVKLAAEAKLAAAERILHRPPAPEQPAVSTVQNAAPIPAANTVEIQKLIDTILVREPENPGSAPAPRSAAALRHAALSEERLILLSRTLAGLIDLIVVLFCTAGFIFATDAYSGVVVLDRISVAHYIVLLLAIFFLYSLFFLATGNQTIGMMITDLRLTAGDGRRPRFRQIVVRCTAYLVSLLALGTGLLWGCFSRRSRCLHDTISGTFVVRL
jgi:uncharacterized RDD family membrane protein YckC